MREQVSYPSEQLLQEWQYRREMVNYYFGVLLRLTPHDNDASQQWRELKGKLSTELSAFRHARDQLRSYEQEHANRKPSATIMLRTRDARHISQFLGEFGKEAIFRWRVIESDPFQADSAVPYLHT